MMRTRISFHCTPFRSFIGLFFLLGIFLMTLPQSFATTAHEDYNCNYNCKKAGEIGHEQTISTGSKPQELKETKAPECEPGEKEYLWLYYSSTSGGWKEIPNSNTKNYQPDYLYRTTYFLRCVRKKGCSYYIESNIVRIAVVDCVPSGIEVGGETCLDDPITFTARKVYTSKPITYKWTFSDGASRSTAEGETVDVSWSTEGLKKVTLQVSYGVCDFTYEKEVYVYNCDCKGFYCRVSSGSNCGVGWARANGYGGAEPYSYRWSNGSTSRSQSGLSPGSYGVTITDANGCKCERYIQIKPADDISCRAWVKYDPDCGKYNGKACAQGYGGSGYYSYRWSNGEYGQCAYRLGAGRSYVTITDKKSGCKTVCYVDLKDKCCRDDFKLMVEEKPQDCQFDKPSVKISLKDGIPNCTYAFAGTITPSGGGVGVSFHGQFVGPMQMSTFTEIDFGSTICVELKSLCNPYCKPIRICKTISDRPVIDCNPYCEVFSQDKCGCVPIDPPQCDPNCEVYNPNTCKCDPIVPKECDPTVVCDGNGNLYHEEYDPSTCKCVRVYDDPPVCNPTVVCDGNGNLYHEEYDPSTCKCERVYDDPPVCDPTVVCDGNGNLYHEEYDPSTCKCERVYDDPPVCDDNDCTTDDSYNLSTCKCEYEPNDKCPLEDSEGNFYCDCEEMPSFHMQGGAAKVFICHYQGNGTYDLIDIACNGLNGHCPHMDGRDRIPYPASPDCPGESVGGGGGNNNNVTDWNCSCYNVTTLMADPLTNQEGFNNANPTNKGQTSAKELEHNYKNHPWFVARDKHSISSVFPNPFHESVNIVFSTTLEMTNNNTPFGKTLTIEVMNITGQVIRQQIVDNGVSQQEIDLSDQAKGVYLIKVSGEGIKPEVHRVVKQ